MKLQSIFLACALVPIPAFAEEGGWKKQIDQQVGLLGHRNMIIIADSAFDIIAGAGASYGRPRRPQVQTTISGVPIGPDIYSGFGGQLDFVRGAARSNGGKPIIALPSTACKGTVSRIAGVLDEGAGVVTTRAHVHYVVTEFGVANLFGKSLRRRAEELIEIAHPDFRGELRAVARARKWIV